MPPAHARPTACCHTIPRCVAPTRLVTHAAPTTACLACATLLCLPVRFTAHRTTAMVGCGR